MSSSLLGNKLHFQKILSSYWTILQVAFPCATDYGWFGKLTCHLGTYCNYHIVLGLRVMAMTACTPVVTLA